MEDIKKDKSFQELKKLFASLQEKYNIDSLRLIELLTEKEIFIPVSVFNDTLSTLETISKFLHENLGLGFTEIGRLIDRSEKTIWQAYSFSQKKQKDKFVITDTKYLIPVSVFADRKYSNLENAVVYLKDHYGLKFSEVAHLLKRDQRTVWTVYTRAKKK